VNFSRPNNGEVIFSQTAIVNKSQRGKCFTIAVCEKIAPGDLFGGRFFQATPDLYREKSKDSEDSDTDENLGVHTVGRAAAPTQHM